MVMLYGLQQELELLFMAVVKSGGEQWLRDRGVAVPKKKDLRKILVQELKKTVDNQNQTI